MQKCFLSGDCEVPEKYAELASKFNFQGSVSYTIDTGLGNGARIISAEERIDWISSIYYVMILIFITSWFVMISAQPVRLIYYTILPSVCYHWWLQPSQFFTFLEMGEEFRIQHLASILTKSLKTTLKGEQVAKEFLENKTKFVTAQVSLSAGQWSCKTFPRWTRTRQKWILLRKLLRLKISYQFMTS